MFSKTPEYSFISVEDADNDVCLFKKKYTTMCGIITMIYKVLKKLSQCQFISGGIMLQYNFFFKYSSRDEKVDNP